MHATKPTEVISMGVITELKRRNVFRVGIAYIVAAWLLAQIADLVLDVMGAPDIVLRSLVALLALGFFPAVIFAWAFEMTPEGVKKQSEIDLGKSVTHHTARKLDFVTIGLVIAVVGFVIVERYIPRSGENAVAQDSSQQAPQSNTVSETENIESTQAIAADRRSIAVLPFANRSNQDDDLFFTDGIHDDLLTQLAKIHDLTVISRTSVMEYRDTSKNLKEIGAELGVGTILEGGIQKVGDRVRINTQLIEVATDKHLWAETFDRELTAENIFDIQSEISRKIVQAVAIELTPEEELALSEVPTQNLAAYEAYLRARDITFGANYSRDQELAALPWLEKAIELDPDFTQAYAMLANNYGQIYWRGVDVSEAFLEKYRATIDKALALNPRSPSALRASANYHYRVENDYLKSSNLIQQALENAPGDVDLHADQALSQRRLGMWQESIDSFGKALQLDPANRFYHSIMLETMVSVGEWQRILDNTVPLQDANPDDLDIQVNRAVAIMNTTGDLKPLEQVFEKMNLVASTNYTSLSARVHWLQRDADATIAVLNNPIWMESGGQSAIFSDFREYELANAYRLKGDGARAEELFNGIIDRLDIALNSSLQQYAYSGMTIAICMARLGRFEEALALANRIVVDIPRERDSMLYGWLLTSRAMVIGLAGDHETAIDELDVGMTTPSAFRVTKWDLYYDPNWDFLRDNQRFNDLASPDNIIRINN
jgi:TolB-like protein/Tfp pilus assembly protein PilF